MGLIDDGGQKIKKMLLREQREQMDPYDLAYEAVVKVLGTYAPKPSEVPVPVIVKIAWVESHPSLASNPHLGWILTQHAKVLSRGLEPRPNSEAVLQVLVDMVKDATK